MFSCTDDLPEISPEMREAILSTYRQMLFAYAADNHLTEISHDMVSIRDAIVMIVSQRGEEPAGGKYIVFALAVAHAKNLVKQKSELELEWRKIAEFVSAYSGVGVEDYMKLLF